MNTNNIAVRSFQSELSHIFAFQLFIRGAYLTKFVVCYNVFLSYTSLCKTF